MMTVIRLLLLIYLVQGWVRAADPTAKPAFETVTFYVAGVECAACVFAVNDSVRRLSGIDEVIDGKMVIEVRRAGVSKAIAARHVAAAGVDPVLIVAFGDDHTDEELFAALPAQSLTVAVGADIAVADHRLVDVADVRRVLAVLATAQLATDVVAGHG